MARRKETLTLDDPRALRALAHPARQRLVNELFDGQVLTATEAADLVGLTPSAVSHHLRTLEKWGLARRAAATGDGRERPWEGTAKALRLRLGEGESSRAALQAVVGQVLNEFASELNDFVVSADDDPWRDSFQGLVRGELWLTQEESKNLTALVQDAIRDLAKGRSRARHPKQTRRASFAWSLIPVEPAPQAERSPG